MKWGLCESGVKGRGDLTTICKPCFNYNNLKLRVNLKMIILVGNTEKSDAWKLNVYINSHKHGGKHTKKLYLSQNMGTVLLR